MKKKLLAVVLALALVLALSSLALAADFTVKAGSSAEISSSGNSYTVYAKSNSVELTFTPASDVILSGEGLADNKLTLTAAGATVKATKKVPPENEGDEPTVTTTDYSFALVNVSTYKVTISTSLYDKKGNAYGTDGDDILVPAKLDKVYAKITVNDAEGNPVSSSGYEVTGADKPDENGLAAIAVNDFTDAADVAVKIGGVEVKSRSFTMLRPVLENVYFNNGESNSGRNTLKIKSGTYEYTTQDGYVDDDWNPVFYKPNAKAHSKASITVKRGSTEILPNSAGWYSQRMDNGVVKITVTVSVGPDDIAISQPYTFYLMSENYSGPTVKAFAANASSNGRGTSYQTVVDQENKLIYVFLPDGEDDFYARVTMNGKVADDSLKLDGDLIETGEWTAADTSAKKLTYKDEAGLAYSYSISVIQGDKKYSDAALKSLTVKSGSRSNTADEVDIGFDPKVTEYAFSVSERDVWLNIAAEAKDSHASVFINGRKVNSVTESKLDTDAVTEYEILVVAGDGVTTETYTVTVNGSTGLLQSLSASNVVGLTPAFNADVNTYTAYTAAGTNSTYIVALAKNYSSDYVQVSKANFNSYGQVTSYTALTRAVQGGASVTGELKTGTNIFRVDVLASASATSAKASYYLVINVPTADPKCVVSSQKLYINGKAQTLSAYNIAGNNYLKLRDVAALLDGTVKEMKVDWDASKWTATMVMSGTFTKRGDELTTLTPPSKYALSTQYFTYNAKPVFPLAYNVTGTGDDTGSNYVMLRDVASLLNFGVTYAPTTQTISIDTASKYIPGL